MFVEEESDYKIQIQEIIKKGMSFLTLHKQLITN